MRAVAFVVGALLSSSLVEPDAPIAARAFPSIPPLGSTGTRWQFKPKDGVQKVQLKDLGASHPGMFQLVVKAKHWFTAAAANDAAENTHLTVTIGA